MLTQHENTLRVTITWTEHNKRLEHQMSYQSLYLQSLLKSSAINFSSSQASWNAAGKWFRLPLLANQ
jgi:hypothetical protein